MNKTQVVGIDEVQFFDDDIVDIAIDLARSRNKSYYSWT